MSTFDERALGLTKSFMGDAAERLTNDHKELFLSIPADDTFRMIVSLIKLRSTIDPPKNESEAYALFESLLAELLESGKLKIASYGLSVEGRESFEKFCSLHVEGPKVVSTDPKDIYAPEIQLYRSDMAEFNRRRSFDPEFLRRSNEADALHLF